VAGFVQPGDQLGQAFLAAACGHYLGAGLRERFSRRLADPLVAPVTAATLSFNSCAIPIPPLIHRNSKRQATTAHQ
jgi:hypothetical protein